MFKAGSELEQAGVSITYYIKPRYSKYTEEKYGTEHLGCTVTFLQVPFT